MAFSFNGSSSYIEATSTPITGAPFTMACWFRPFVTTQTASLMYIGNSAASNRFQIIIDGSSLIFTAAAPITANASTPISVVNDLTWFHATAVSFSPTSRFIYLNGGGKIQNTTSRTPTLLNNITIGSQIVSNTRSNFFNGRIAEAGVWNAALTDDEVLSLSKGFAPSLIRPSNLKFYNRCIQKSQDLYGGLNLTEVNLTNFDHPRIYG